MPRVAFEFAEHHDFGTKGWRMRKHPTFDPIDGTGVAHDLLEHRAGDKGSVLEEMQALGAFAFIRMESGLMRQRYRGNMSDAAIVGSDILQVYRDKVFEGKTSELMPTSSTKSKALGYGEYDKMFQEALACVYRSWDDEVHESDAPLKDTFFQGDGALAILGALRRGFRWAERRYLCAASAASLFRRIQEMVNRCSANAEIGDRMVVCYDIASGTVQTTHWDAFGYER